MADKKEKKKEKYKDFDWRAEDKKLKTTATEKVKEEKKRVVKREVNEDRLDYGIE